MNVLRAEAVDQARGMLNVLDSQWPGARDRLRVDVLAELATWTEVQLLEVPDTQADERCSVAGGYVYTTTPPTLTVTQSLSHGRRQFTALHELGHHLQKNDVALAVAVRRQPADNAAFEDAACDAFAARVLIPEAVLDPLLGDRSPTAADVVTVFKTTQASRAASCVRVAERLGSPGVVAVLTADGTVTFAVGQGGIFPPARGTDQATTPLVRAALERGTDVQVDATHVLYRTGSTSDELYGHAVWSGEYLVTVAVLDRPGWKPFAPPRVGTGRFVSGRPWCEVCEEEFPPAEACRSCGSPRCPVGHCSCTLAAERLCHGCFLTRHRSQFVSPSATLCKECSE